MDVCATVRGASDRASDKNPTTTQAKRSFMRDFSFENLKTLAPDGTECLTCKGRTKISAIISRFHPCHAEIDPWETKPHLLPLIRGQLAPAKWATIKARCRSEAGEKLNNKNPTTTQPMRSFMGDFSFWKFCESWFTSPCRGLRMTVVKALSLG